MADPVTSIAGALKALFKLIFRVYDDAKEKAAEENLKKRIKDEKGITVDVRHNPFRAWVPNWKRNDKTRKADSSTGPPDKTG